MSATELMYAILWNTTDVVAALIDEGADMNKKDEYGNTALMVAIIDRDILLADVLIEKGAKIDEKQQPSADEIAKNLDATRDQLLSEKREQMFAVFVTSLTDRYQKQGDIRMNKRAQTGMPLGQS